MNSVIDRENIIMQNLSSSNKLIGSIQLNELPQIISSQVVQIKDLGEKIESAIATANSAKESADNAKRKSVKLGHKAEAITTLQGATVDLAQAQSDTIDALKVSFEYEKKLGDISKYLFVLGAYSDANTRIVIQQLSDELEKEGKSDKISKVAKQRLISVINQLKAQEDVMKQQEILTNKVDEHARQIKDLDRQLDDMEEADEEQDKKIAENAEKLSKYAQVLSAQQRKDQEHDDRISKNSKQIAKHTIMLDRQYQRDEVIEKKVDENLKKIQKGETSLNERTQEQEAKNKAFDKRVTELSQSVSKEFDEFKNSITKNNKDVRNSLSLLEEKFDKQISMIKSNVEQSNKNFEEKLKIVLVEYGNAIGQLKDELETHKVETSNKIKALENRINALDTVMSKRAWKITISIIAIISLLLNILQIFSLI